MTDRKELGSDPTDVPFPTTKPSMVAVAVSRDAPGFREAWERLFLGYWPPLYAYLRRTGSTPDEAQDLVQEFFARGLDGPMLASFDPRKGRLRAFLRACLHNLRSKVRRHERSRPDRGGPALDTSRLEATLADPKAVDPEEAFDREWSAQLLARSIEALEVNLRVAGETVYARVLREWVLNAERPAAAVLAKELGISTADLYTRATRLRQGLARELQVLIHEYTASVAISIEERDAALRALPDAGEGETPRGRR